jgi:hypothetical protein
MNIMEVIMLMSRVSLLLCLGLGLLSSLCSYIHSDASWKELESDAITGAYGDLAWKSGGLLGVRRTLLYTPDVVEENKQPIAVVVVHGTFAADSEDYYQNARYFFPDIQEYGRQLAVKEKVPVKVIFYRWSGYENHLYRCEAGKHLAQVINKHADHKIITVAHSHGGNVVNYASNYITNSIDLMIHFAVPVVHENDVYKPNNFKMLCSFYSTSDLIQLLGATDAHRGWQGARKMWQIPLFTFRGYSVNNVGPAAGKVINIRTQINGCDADHTDIKYCMPAVSKVLDTISEKYPLHDDLCLNVDFRQQNPEHQVLLAIREPKKGTAENESLYKAELAYSDTQRELYKKLYDVDMAMARPRLRFLSSVFINTLLLVPRVRWLFHKYQLYKAAPLVPKAA